MYSKKFDYSEGNAHTSFSIDIPFNQINEQYISIRYAASGFFNELFYSHGNQWNCSNAIVTLTPYK